MAEMAASRSSISVWARGGIAILVGAIWFALSAGSAGADRKEPKELTATFSGTFESSFRFAPSYDPGHFHTQTVSLKWSEKGEFDDNGRDISSPRLTVSGKEKESNDIRMDPLGNMLPPDPQENCTGKISAKPYRQWKHITLINASIDAGGPTKGIVNGIAFVPFGTEQPPNFLRSRGSGNCSQFNIIIDGTPEDEALHSHVSETAHFRDTELRFNVRHRPFRYKKTVGTLSYSFELIDRFSVET
jgi:hypothetical protein